ncbi:MAG: cation/H(+) antiporter [Burkholderiales bacterium]|nr:MAG: cation/H(+) antiporter [Burkholderiales bacterium]
MHHSSFLQDLAVVLAVSGLVTVLFNRLKQPVVLGYILAGLIIGPHTPPFPLVRSVDTVNTLAELGIIFLMFALGLEFSFKKLTAVGATALVAASLEIIGMVGAGYALGQVFGWGFMDSLFLGGILAISSTTIIIKALQEMKATRDRFAQLIFGILVVEDILGILIIALLSSIAASGNLDITSLTTVTWKLGVFLAVIFVGGVLFVPRILSYVSRFRNSEMLLVTSLALCFGVSYLAYAFEYSVALGAFVIGAIIAETRQARQVEALTHSLRDMFGAVFFVSVGMLIEPKIIWDNMLVISVVTFVVIVGKVITCSFGAFLTGSDRSTAMRVGLGLSQIGEFSFIIAALGISKGVTSGFLYPVAVAVSAITTLTTPYLIRNSPAITRSFEKIIPQRFLELADSYTRSLSVRRPSGVLRDPYVRRGLIQLVLNLLLLSAVFSGAAWASRFSEIHLEGFPGGENGRNAILWAATMLLTSPLQVVTVRRAFRTARAIGELLSQQSRYGGAILRNAVPPLISSAFVLVFSALILGFSAAFLPPAKILWVLLAGIVLTTLIFRNRAIGFYKRMQESFESTLAQQNQEESDHHKEAESGTLLPASAEVFRVIIDDHSPIAGRFIKDIELRKITGASIVCIEREESSIVNPEAGEVILGGDTLLLLGSAQQLTAAREWLWAGKI